MGRTTKLEWDDLRLIKAVADGGTLPAAAQRLGVNHSTVFRRLNGMEAALGTRLFERHRSGYVATAAGEEAIALARRVDEDVTALNRKLAGQAIEPAGELRVTLSDTLALDLVLPLLPGFRGRCPEIRLDLVIANEALNLSRRDADVAIRATDAPPDTLVGRRIARLAWALYGRQEDVEGWQERDWIAPGDELTGLKAVRLAQSGVPARRIACRINTVLGMADVIEAGLGVGFLPCFVADTRRALARLAVPDPALSTDLWLLTHPDLRHAPRVRAFLDYMAAEIGQRRNLLEGKAGERAERMPLGEPAEQTTTPRLAPHGAPLLDGSATPASDG